MVTAGTLIPSQRFYTYSKLQNVLYSYESIHYILPTLYGCKYILNTSRELGDPLLLVLSRVTVTKDGVRLGNWIYWILTGCNYK
jgi:hypothetical protein